MRTRPQAAGLALLLGATAAPAAAIECAPSYGHADEVVAACTAVLGRSDLAKEVRARALRDRAAAYTEKKDADRALADLTDAIGVTPKDDNLYYYRASLHRFERKDVERSLADIDQALRIRPDSYPYKSFRGDLDVQRNDLEAATADYGEEIRLNPKSVTAYDTFGNVWLMRGDYGRALEAFDTGYKIDSNYSNIIKDRNRAHAALAAAAALAKAEGSSDAARGVRADQTADLYSGGRSWTINGAFHHCTFEDKGEKTAVVVAQGRAGYVMAIASSEWALSPGGYKVEMSIGSGPKLPATAVVADPISVSMPLGNDRAVIARLAEYNSPISLQADRTTIPVADHGLLYLADKLDACWKKGTATAEGANPFGPAGVKAAGPSGANPFAGGAAAIMTDP